MSTFYERYQLLRRNRRSLLCVGLDPDQEFIPEEYGRIESPSAAASLPFSPGQAANSVPHFKSRDALAQRYASFLEEIIEAVIDKVIAFKLNLAFYEVLGPVGLELFHWVVASIRARDRQVLVIADAKRGDVGHSARFYAKTFFETFSCDGLTVNSYLGMDALAPFLKYREQAIMLLCHTSNGGADLFQAHGQPPLFIRVAEEAARYNSPPGGLWLVVGATRCPQNIGQIRQAAPQIPFLVPGIGAQGGDLSAVFEAAGNNLLINAGRSILYAAKRRKDVKTVAAKQCCLLVEEMAPFL